VAVVVVAVVAAAAAAAVTAGRSALEKTHLMPITSIT
jgi:hypothetical protein